MGVSKTTINIARATSTGDAQTKALNSKKTKCLQTHCEFIYEIIFKECLFVFEKILKAMCPTMGFKPTIWS